MAKVIECLFCESEATTDYSFQDGHGSVKVCALCAKKLEYIDECEARFGTAPRIDQISERDLQSVGLL